MDGYITIGTELDTDKFDRQISDLEKKMKNEEDKKIIIKTQLDTQQRQLEDAREKTDQLADAYQRLKQILSNPNEFKARFGEYGDIISQFGRLPEIEKSFDKAINRQDALEQKVMRTELKYQQINNRVAEYKQKIEGIRIQQQTQDVGKLGEQFNKVGSSIQRVVKRAGLLILSIFGIRTALSLLSRASSDLARYDEQYAVNLEYIRYVLAEAIAPVLKWIVRMIVTILGYINAILQGWFGINLFARGSAENFNKMRKNANGVTKAVKEIKKQLAGFDEINMLTKDSDTGTKAGGGGIATPDFDLSNLQAEPPEWLQWIIDHKDLILAIMSGILSFLLAWKMGLSAIQSLGIGIMIAGIVYAIINLIKYLKDPSWENFGGVIQGIGIAIVGLGILIGSVQAIIIGAVVLIVGTIIRNWDTIKAYLENGIKWLTSQSETVHKYLGGIIGNIYDTLVKDFQLILKWLDTVFKSAKQIFDGIIKFIAGTFTGDWKKAWDGIKDIFTGLWKIMYSTFTTYWKLITSVVATAGKTVGTIIGTVFKAVVNAVLGAVEYTLNSPIRKINSFIGVINNIPRSLFINVI